MTTGYGCNFCDEPRPVAWLITSLSNGETLAICAEDFPVALIPLLAGELGVDPARFYDTVKRFTDREAAREAKAAAKAPQPPDEPDEPDEPPVTEYDPGPEMDDEGGMSERRSAEHPETVGWS